MRRCFLLLLALLLVPAAAHAQIAGPPYIFVTDTIADADQVNANFAAVYAAALNRTGPIVSGLMLFSPDNTFDIGQTASGRPRDLNIARNATIGGTLAVTGASTFTGAATFNAALSLNSPLTVTSTTAPQLTARYDVSNRLEVSVASNGATTFNAVGAGQAFAFSDPVTVGTFTGSGIATFASTVLVASAGAPIKWQETDAAANNGKWLTQAETGLFSLQAVNDAETVSSIAWSVARSGTTVTSFDVAAAQMRGVAGTAATPSISFTGDPDVGFYSAGTNILGIATQGTARWTFDALGNFVPATDGTIDIGSSSVGVRSIWLDDGTNNLPPIHFKGRQDSGFYYDTLGDYMAIVKSGAELINFGSAAGVRVGSLFTAGWVTTQTTRYSGVTFANIGTTPSGTTNGTVLYCSDCTVASPCAGAGTGAIAKRLNGSWVCN